MGEMGEMGEKGNCGDCAHFRPDEAGSLRFGGYCGDGECLRYPPVFVAPGASKSGRAESWGSPVVFTHDRCGEFTKAIRQ